MTDQARGELVPGGLAIIISAEICVRNIGRIVTLKTLTKGLTDYGGGLVLGGRWIVEGDIEVFSDDEGIVSHGWTACMPSQLMPINPEADPLSIDQSQECEA